MNRRKLIIGVVVVVIVILTGLGAYIYINTTKDTPDSKTSDKQLVSKEEKERIKNAPVPDAVDPHYHDNQDEQPVTVGDKEFSVDVMIGNYLPLAEAAAREYVNQNTNESGDQRVARLEQVFIEGSPIVYDSPPAVDKSNSDNAGSTATVLYTDWEALDDSINVTVFLRVNTTKNDTKEQVSQIYQAYDVTLLPVGDSFQASDIVFVNRPVVIRG